MGLWTNAKGGARLEDEALRDYISSMEEAFLERLNKSLSSYQEAFQSRGLQVQKERYWSKYKQPPIEKKSQRLPLEKGYWYACGYSLKKDGKFLTNRSWAEVEGVYEIFYLRVKVGRLSSLLYRLGLLKDLEITVQTASEEEIEKFLRKDIDYALRCVDVGFYSTKYSD